MARRSGPSHRARARKRLDRNRTRTAVADLLNRQPEPTQRHHRRPGPASAAPHLRRRWLLLGGLAMLVVAGLSVVGMLVQGSENHGVTGDADDVALRARAWLDAYAPGLVLTEAEFREQLLHAGWASARVATAASCTPTTCPADWLVITPAMRTSLSGGGPLDSAVRNSTPVAMFGSGDDRVEIRHAGARTAEETAAELRARTTVGQALAGSPLVAADPGVQALLNTGRADPRVLAMLATLAQRGAAKVAVRVLDLPAVPGEDAAEQPRRQMLLAMPADGAEALTQFFAAQNAPYRPADVAQTPAGLLVRYPPVAPPNLLDAVNRP